MLVVLVSSLPESELLREGSDDVVPPGDPVGQAVPPKVPLGLEPEPGVVGGRRRCQGTEEQDHGEAEGDQAGGEEAWCPHPDADHQGVTGEDRVVVLDSG